MRAPSGSRPPRHPGGGPRRRPTAGGAVDTPTHDRPRGSTHLGQRDRHVLTRSLGTTGAIDVDALTVEIRPGDRFLLCSDGVCDVLADSTLGALLDGPDDGRVAARIVAAALDAGSGDDTTAIVADVVRTIDRELRPSGRTVARAAHTTTGTGRGPG